MNVSVFDASQYFRGLLVLIRRDGEITKSESESVARLGAKLGFEREFCLEAIEDILSNSFVSDESPEFESAAVARKFIRDGIRIVSDKGRSILPAERHWLEGVARANGCSGAWFEEECELAERRPGHPEGWEFESICVIHGSRMHNPSTPSMAGSRPLHS
jgi:hypothetical protein